MSAVILENEIVHYEVLGRGRPVVFLHGWVGSWRYWISAMQSASVSYRAYAVDLYGFGDSSKNEEKYSLERQSRLLDGFLDKLGIERAAIVGHGLGAVLSLDFAARRPGAADRVMAVSFPFRTQHLSPRLGISSPNELAEWLLAKVPASEETRVEASKSDSRAIMTSLQELEGIDLQEFAGSLLSPCLFVHGQTDAAVNPPTMDEIALSPDYYHHIVFDQSGHFPMLEENSRFNRLLADFLSLAPGESPRQLQLKEEWKRRVR